MGSLTQHRQKFSAMTGTFLEYFLIRGLWLFNGLLHVVLAVALVMASIMVVAQFFAEAYVVFQHLSEGLGEVNLVRGFLHALGVLFIVWTLSALISAEVEYVRTGQFHVRVFIEVAMVTLLRQLIVMPVQTVAGGVQLEQQEGLWSYVLVLGAILVVAITHRLVGEATTSSFLGIPNRKTEPKADPDSAEAPDDSPPKG